MIFFSFFFFSAVDVLTFGGAFLLLLLQYTNKVFRLMRKSSVISTFRASSDPV